MGSVAIPGFEGLGWVWEAVCSVGLEEVLGSGSGRRSGEVWEVGLGGRM